MEKLFTNSVVVAFLTVVSQSLGYLRELLFAYYLGTSSVVEAFQVAETVPLLFTQVLIGAVPLALTPLLVREFEKEKDTLIHNAVSMFSIILVVIMIVLMIFPEIFVKTVASGFSGNTFTLTCRLVTILAPNVVFLSLVAVFTAFMNARNQFIIPAAIALILNINIVITQVLTEADVYAVARASVTSGFFMFLFSIMVCVKKYKFYFQPHKISRHTLKKIVMALAPVCAVAGVTSMNLLLDKAFASQLTNGSIAVLTYSYKIIYLPVYLFATAVSKVLLPSITRMIMEEDFVSLKVIIKKISAVCFLGGIAFTVLLYFYAELIVRLLFGRGAFVLADMEATTSVIKLYSCGTIGMALTSFFQSVSYANGNFFLPFKILLIQLGIYTVIAYFFRALLGVNGIVLGNVVAVSCSAIIWIFVLRKQYNLIKKEW